jgi:hypothetical protein
VINNIQKRVGKAHMNFKGFAKRQPPSLEMAFDGDDLMK